jgi:hypothetical protein
MKFLSLLLLLPLVGCAKKENPAIRAWLDSLDPRDAALLHTGLSSSLPTKSDSVSVALSDYISHYPRKTEVRNRPIVEKLGPSRTAYIFEAKEEETDGFLILCKTTQKLDRPWDGKFIPADWYKKNEK